MYANAHFCEDSHFVGSCGSDPYLRYFAWPTQYLSYNWSQNKNDHKFPSKQESPYFAFAHLQVTTESPEKCNTNVSNFVHPYFLVLWKYYLSASSVFSLRIRKHDAFTDIHILFPTSPCSSFHSTLCMLKIFNPFCIYDLTCLPKCCNLLY
jgi:hypothetical protein